MDEHQMDADTSEPIEEPATEAGQIPTAIQNRLSDPSQPEPIELREEASQPFIGKWNQLVSHTNWEKGRIICEWRDSLIEDGAPATAYSDEAWSRMVGGVTSQHVGRLRRVSLQFADSFEVYRGLFWSHFQAALDWNDAEMWLEGAVQNKWSVSQMRAQRWEARGADPEQKPHEADVISDIDEDYEPLQVKQDDDQQHHLEDGEIVTGPRSEGPDFGDEGEFGDRAGADGNPSSETVTGAGEKSAADLARPFENLAELPEDVADAFDAFKLAIIRHRSNEWADISMTDMLGCLDALKELAKLESHP